MEPSKVYFTDFHTVAFGDGLPTKLKKLIKKAGIEKLDMDGKFVAIKILTDCNTMYPGSRKNALEHLECAW